VMCAYNAVDGKPACANEQLVNGTLRTAWGFAGHVTSDCGAIDDIATGHKFTKTNVEATAVALKAGTDMNCGFKNEYLDLPKAVAAGLISEKDIDAALKRVLGTRARLGILPASTATPWSNVAFSENHSQPHRELALRAAREAIVLLKNDKILPLAPGKRVAVVGPTAASLIALEGNYNGTPVGAVLPVDGMTATYGAENVRYAQGSPFVDELPLPVSRTALRLVAVEEARSRGPALTVSRTPTSAPWPPSGRRCRSCCRRDARKASRSRRRPVRRRRRRPRRPREARELARPCRRRIHACAVPGYRSRPDHRGPHRGCR